jgi:UDP-N-acetylmuramoylalanine--D-glutamate ligase
MGASTGAIERAATAFRGAEHTLEHVATVGGIAFFNDSKATNVEAARRSVESFPGRVLLIAGGRYKGGDFAELGPPLERRGGMVLAIGEAQPRLEAALAPFVPVLPCATLQEAVDRAAEAARTGDTVVLAPACSSFDMFQDYADRGRSFKAAVLRLREARH